jgi:hypothetical protein
MNQAMQDTRTKADILASAAGMKLVGVKSINLNEFAIQLLFLLLFDQQDNRWQQQKPTNQLLLYQDKKRSLPM